MAEDDQNNMTREAGAGRGPAKLDGDSTATGDGSVEFEDAPTELMPGGVGRPAPVTHGVPSEDGGVSHAGEAGGTSCGVVAPESGAADSREAEKGVAPTAPMPKPASRPDDPTAKLVRGAAVPVDAPSPAGLEGAAPEPEGAAGPVGPAGAEPPMTTPSDAQMDSEVAGSATSDASGGGGSSSLGSSSSSVRGPSWLRSRRVRVAAAVCAAVLLVVAVAAGTYAAQLWGGRTLPDVTGLSAADARSALESAGFSVEVRNTPADEGLGTVLDTDPDAGVRTRLGSTVILHVGVPRVVPTVRGASLDTAKRALADAGITNIRLTYKNSDEDENTILGVDPGEGSVVTADEEVTLQVAQPYTVPDVTGLSQDDATKALAEAGLLSKVEWRESEGDSYQVLETSPAAGSRVSSGSTVTVTVVAPGPRSETYLADYLAKTPQGISSYLSWKGWSFQFGTTAKGTGAFAGKDLAEEGWSKTGVGSLTFTPDPNTGHHGIFLGSLLTQDVLASGAQIAGVRYVPDKQALGSDNAVDSATVNTWATRLGLTGLEGVVSGSDVASTLGISGRAPDMLTGYGEMDGNTWSVTVVKGSGVVVTCAPSSLYESADLGQYGNSVGIYMAYLEGFTG